jgi:hypothetical protein
LQSSFIGRGRLMRDTLIIERKKNAYGKVMSGRRIES